jgi:hypothetical protein
LADEAPCHANSQQAEPSGYTGCYASLSEGASIRG